jgi:hypothetical protein
LTINFPWLLKNARPVFLFCTIGRPINGKMHYLDGASLLNRWWRSKLPHSSKNCLARSCTIVLCSFRLPLTTFGLDRAVDVISAQRESLRGDHRSFWPEFPVSCSVFAGQKIARFAQPGWHPRGVWCQPHIRTFQVKNYINSMSSKPAIGQIRATTITFKLT